MAHRSLDRLDKKILQLISEDARIPFLEVARACNVSGAAIHQRIQKLTNLGVSQRISVRYRSGTYRLWDLRFHWIEPQESREVWWCCWGSTPDSGDCRVSLYHRWVWSLPEDLRIQQPSSYVSYPRQVDAARSVTQREFYLLQCCYRPYSADWRYESGWYSVGWWRRGGIRNVWFPLRLLKMVVC